MDLQNKPLTRLHCISLCSSALICAISLLVLAGWYSGSLALTSVLPGMIPMNPAVALCFFALAIPIVFLALHPETTLAQNWEMTAIGAVVVIVATLRLAAYLGAENLHIDSILFAQELVKVPFAPNRMAPNTALGLLFGGLGVSSVVWRKTFTRHLTGVAAVGLLLTGLYGVANYLFTVFGTNVRGEYIPTAMHTAAAMLLLLAGISALDEHIPIIRQFIKGSPGGMILRRLLPPLIVFPIFLGWLRIFCEYRLHISGMPASAATAVVLQIIVFCVLVWAAALILDRLNEQRQQTMQRLEQAKSALEIAKAAAEDSARVKSQFLANMSHEIRTPLHGVISMMELLAETSLDGQQRSYTQVARISADALLAVIRDILDFSKIEAGRMELELIDFDLRTGTEDTVYLMLASAMRKKLELGYDIAPDIPSMVRGDPVRLRQVLMNLIGNAIKFTDKGEVWVKLSAEAMADGRILARFEVHDTGMGIAPEDAAKLFNAFSQAHHIGNKVHGGTGLGLAISRQLVELMGGKIEVHSRLNQGSTFWFTVPLECRKSVWLDAEAIPEALHRQRILLLMASGFRRDKLQHQLQYWKIEVETVATVEACNRLLRTNTDHPFDVLFVEHQPPELNALEIAGLLQAQTEARIPGIIVLARPDTQISPDIQRHFGLAGVLAKPVRQSQLFDLLMRLVNDNSAATSHSQLEPTAKIQLPAGYQGTKVLVAEDNEINQFVIREVLSGLRLSCDVVSNGYECLEALEKQSYAVILMDCLMPMMDGFETAAAIRQLESTGSVFSSFGKRRIPIIALTANATGLDRRNSLEAGMDAFLTKPLDRIELTHTLTALIENPHLPSPTAGLPMAHADESDSLPDHTVSPSEPFDFKRLGAYFPKDPKIMERLLEQFLGQGRQQMEKLNASMIAPDWDSARRAAHGIKGTAACLFAEALRQAAADMEAICRDHESEDQARAARNKVQTEMIRCIEYLTKRLAAAGKISADEGV